MKVRIKFFEPIRVMPWVNPSDRKISNEQFMRGQSFARWHRYNKNSNSGKPFITGTLVRSAVIRAAEVLLSLSNGIIENKACCPGMFETEGAARKKKMHFRQRSTPKWTENSTCNKDNQCPFCELLGRFGNDEIGAVIEKENNTKRLKYNFHFSNFQPSGNNSYPDHIIIKRTVNRVDYTTGKAHDFFTISEIDNSFFPAFEGHISISDRVSHEAKKLLSDSLKFIDKLCGSICVFEFDDSTWDDHLHIEKSMEKNDGKEKSEEITKQIIKILESNSKLDYLRILSDAIRELARDKEMVHKLPLDYKGKKKHYIWDLAYNKISIREILCNQANKNAKNDYVELCKTIGKELYHESQKKTELLTKPHRILGSKSFYGKPQRDIQPTDAKIVPTEETIFTGKLVSETPFFFGLENEDKQQTDFTVLLDSQNRFRIPRSALRGVLRRDIRMMSGGNGCDVKLGGRQCLCPVCRMMRNITIMDVRSNKDIIPDIRQRIRINPYTGSVAEGALFSMELGPQGMEFDFVLRFRGNDSIPKSLKKVLLCWAKGQAFLSGASSTGKGRFKLKNLKFKSFDLSTKEIRNDYLNQRGWRNRENELPLEPLFLTDKYKEINTTLWNKVSVEIKLSSPFLNGDPVRSLVQGQGADIVSFKKTSLIDDEDIYAYKAESLKGIFRTALARRFHYKDKISQKVLPLTAISHKDCDCPLCRLFGSEFETGKIRFEDLEFSTNPIPKKFDHVAIDRFTGGAVDKKKFDDCALSATKQKPLLLKGNFWLRPDMTKDDFKYFEKAFLDIKSGFYPLGAKSGIGYGQIEDISISISDSDDYPRAIKENIKTINNKSYTQEAKNNINDKDTDESKQSDFQIDLKDDAIYYPHYFLKPNKKVDRKTIPINHLTLHDECHTGKIVCTLTTKTPLIIPDTENDDAFGLKKAKLAEDGEKYHKSYSFFSVNDEIMISGSEIRGMISSIYEAITNSCFRIFEEKHRLSWRMEAVPEVLEKFIPGRIIKINGELKMVEMEEVRYPFYDKNCPDTKTQKDHFSSKGKGKLYYEQPTFSDKMILSLSEYNRKHQNPGKKEKYKIIKPDSKSNANFMFTATPANNTEGYDMDCVHKHSVKGYLKVSGPNKIEKERTDQPASNKIPMENEIVIHQKTNRREITVQNAKKNKKRYRLIPEYICSEKDTNYIMNKRCERVFIEPEKCNHDGIPISKNAIELFKHLVDEYKKNADQQETPKVFRTKLPEKGELKEGSLVYFRKDSNEVVEIIPVKISRKIDDRFIGKRLTKNLRPCHGEWIEKDDLSILDQYPEKKLFTRHPKGLCPACQLFGTGAYKGRLRFGFATLTNKPEWLNKEDKDHKLTLPLLERPRPTWAIPDATQASKVPGRKFFIHHHAWTDIEKGIDPVTGKAIQIDVNNRTVQPLDSNNTFTFEINFENLEPHELGLLLYSLQLENSLSHKLGMGKAFGFGSIDIKVENLLLFDSTIDKYKNKTDQVKRFVDEGKNNLLEIFENEFDDIEHIKDLKSLLYFPNDKNIRVQYPLLRKEDYPDKDLPGYKELKDNFSNGIQIRHNLLTIPWSPWAYQSKKKLENEKTIYPPLKKIEINNYYDIKKVNIKIPDNAQWVFLTGNNSIGKSLFLKAIATGLYGKITEDDENDIDTNCGIRVFITNEWVNDVKKDYFNQKLSYKNYATYGPSRLNKLAEGKKTKFPYFSLFNTEGVFYHDIEKEFIKWCDRDSSKFNLLKNIFIKLLPTIDDIKGIQTKTDFYIGYKEMETGKYEKQSKLATGNISILRMFGDMFIRFSKEQPDTLPEDFSGIVIIDELDLHLHPIWLKKIPGLVSKLFPKIRFIASTHSAIPFLGAPKNSVYLNVIRDEDNNIHVQEIDIDLTNLLPNTILTSPLFNMEDITQINLPDITDVRTEDTYKEIIEIDKIKARLKKFAKKDTLFPDKLFKEL